MQINDLNVALDVLLQAVAIGQSKGIYTIKEAGFISAAIEYLEELSGGPKEEVTTNEPEIQEAEVEKKDQPTEFENSL